MKQLLIVILYFITCQTGYCSIDFESGIQDFVLETRQILIPEYPTAFNPSIIKINNEYLMTFRFIPNRKVSYNSEIGVVWLNENFEPITKPQVLNLTPKGVAPYIPSRAEDARLIQVGKSIYLVYDDNRDEKLSKGGFRVYVSKLDIQNRKVIPTEIDPITYYDGEDSNLREKNWVPFVFQGDLLLSYSISPHKIFRYLPGLGACETLTETHPSFNWNYGILRGGTPALPIDENNYISFFHSSVKMASLHSDDKEVLHYFIGAYTFSRSYPFKITKMSPEPIVGKNFYHGEIYKPYWHPVRVVYASGLLINPEDVIIFYGRQDHEIWLARFNKKGLLDSLKPIK